MKLSNNLLVAVLQAMLAVCRRLGNMKCALAAMGFIDGDIQYNKSVIIDTMKNYDREY